MRILGIETSCDDTGAAVVEDGRILSNIAAAQDVHIEYGGVVPELASRAHITLLPRVVRQALDTAHTTIEHIDAVAVTLGPGLVGSLLVGIEFAKGLAIARGIPWVGVNHVEAHLVSAGLESDLEPPYVGMVASGGHTEIYHVPEPGLFRRIGSTRDDAAGEAFDKVGKLLGLPYPAGPHMDRLAREGRSDQVPLPRARLKGDTLDLSMSGLKTAPKLLLELRESRRNCDHRQCGFARCARQIKVFRLDGKIGCGQTGHFETIDPGQVLLRILLDYFDRTFPAGLHLLARILEVLNRDFRIGQRQNFTWLNGYRAKEGCHFAEEAFAGLTGVDARLLWDRDCGGHLPEGRC